MRDKALFTVKRFLLVLITLIFLGILYFSYQYSLFERIKFNIIAWRHANEWKDKSLWLNDYQIFIEGQPIKGIHKNLSGLCWNNDSKSLFAVVNHPEQVVELTTKGKILRYINLIGINDPESIEYLGNNKFIISDERSQKIVLVTIDKDTTQVSAEGAAQFTLGMGGVGNKGLEGITWDASQKKIYAAKEKDPVHIYEVTGFPQAANSNMNLEVSNNSIRDQQLFLKDLSGLAFNEHYNHLLILSAESRLVVEIDKQGNSISSLSLLIGHGLSQPIRQAEGLALDNEDNIYIVAEPNLFYVFKKKTATTQ